MKKGFVVFFVALGLIFAANAQAMELQFRIGPALGIKDWTAPSGADLNQLKLGINFATTSKGAESGFYASTSFDIALLKSVTILWLTPEFQYDIKIGGLPLYIYPKLGLDMFFTFFDGGKSFGFGIKPAAGVKFDLMEWFFIWAEPFGMNMIFTNYTWLDAGVGGVPGIALGGWNNSTVISYDIMAGVGFRL